MNRNEMDEKSNKKLTAYRPGAREMENVYLMDFNGLFCLPPCLPAKKKRAELSDFLLLASCVHRL